MLLLLLQLLPLRKSALNDFPSQRHITCTVCQTHHRRCLGCKKIANRHWWVCILPRPTRAHIVTASHLHSIEQEVMLAFQFVEVSTPFTT